MGGIVGGRRTVVQAAQKPEAEIQKPDTGRREQAAAMQARRRTGGATRSLLSGAREEAMTGLTNKLGGGS